MLPSKQHEILHPKQECREAKGNGWKCCHWHEWPMKNAFFLVEGNPGFLHQSREGSTPRSIEEINPSRIETLDGERIVFQTPTACIGSVVDDIERQLLAIALKWSAHS